MRRPDSLVQRENEAILALGKTRRYSEADACREIGVNPVAFGKRKYKDPQLAALVHEAFSQHKLGPVEVPDLVTFRQECFGHDTPHHMMEWLEALEDPSVEALLILVPPSHAKTSFMEEWLTWHIVKDRSLQSLYISKSQPASIKRLGRIKRLLSDDAWYRAKKLRSVPAEWGPFKPVSANNRTWSKTQIYVEGADAEDRDATVEALGIGNQIQGARADKIVNDDIATRQNQLSPQQVENMLDTLGQDILSRLPPKGGKLVIAGTRVDPGDIYGPLLDTDEFTDGEGRKVKLTKIVRPAILDEVHKRTLWPAVWDYDTLAARRDGPLMRPRVWSLTYQQQASDLPDAPFPTALMEEAKLRDPDFMPGVPPAGMKTVVGYDPAVTGTAAAVVLGVMPGSKTRWILDCVTGEGFMSNDKIKSFLYDICRKWNAKVCRVEETSWQKGMFNDMDFLRAMREFGIRVTKEQTQMNKFDPDIGVEICASRFEAGQYVIPWNHRTKPRLGPLLSELSTWRKVVGKRQVQNRVMALWLAERACMETMNFNVVVPPPDPGVSKRTQRSAYEQHRRGVTSLKDRLHAV